MVSCVDPRRTRGESRLALHICEDYTEPNSEPRSSVLLLIPWQQLQWEPSTRFNRRKNRPLSPLPYFFGTLLSVPNLECVLKTFHHVHPSLLSLLFLPPLSLPSSTSHCLLLFPPMSFSFVLASIASLLLSPCYASSTFRLRRVDLSTHQEAVRAKALVVEYHHLSLLNITPSNRWCSGGALLNQI